jgi:riboflavin kinase
MDILLLFLAERGALESRLRITTVEIGESNSMSQQNASVRIRKLKQDGMIEVSPLGIRITPKGKEALSRMHSRLSSILLQKSFSFSGKVVRGAEKGRYFLSLAGYAKRIQEAVGFTPFPGTINLEIGESQIEGRIALREHRGIRIPGFRHEGKDYGEVELYPCTILGHEGAILFPYRSHHGLRVLELISPHDLSKKAGIGEGSRVEVEVVFQ